MNDQNSRRVYSTDEGRIRDEPPRRARRPAAAPGAQAPADGVVRVGRTSSGRRGKTVTQVTGAPPADLPALATELKRLCGAGGAVVDGVVEIQGDHRARILAHLEGRYRLKPTGG